MQPVFLIGFMGAGKTTLGKLLSSALNCPFLDTDRMIEVQEGKSISQIFAENGEAYFRSLEKQLIAGIAPNELIVVATGGGLPCFNQQIEVLNEKGITVFLNPSVELLFNRLIKEADERPLLEGMSRDELFLFIESTLHKRIPFYSKAEIVLKDVNLEDLKGIIYRLNLPPQKN